MARGRIIALSLLALAAVGSATRAWAEEAKPAPGQFVNLSPVALPIIANGRLVNYVFATVKISLTPQADALALQTKEPYFRDALVRAAHRTPFVVRNDYNRIDDAKLRSAVYRDAVAIAGPGKIAAVTIVDETPQHHVPPPGGSRVPAPSIVP